ncbi:MAG: HD domain-containing phosphohydrolase [Brevinematales bacterium]|jgi:putative two-component system response regulator
MSMDILKNETLDIMIVDDEPANLQILSEILKQRGYKVRPTASGKQALQGAGIEPPDLILLDINMPGMSGYQVCTMLKQDAKLCDIPVIFISALSETMDKVKAFSVGGIDFVTKPFHYEEVQARVETHLKLHLLQMELEKHNKKLEELVLAQVKEISESQMATIFALAKLAESRDDDTGKHQERVQTLCSILCNQMTGKKDFKIWIDGSFIQDMIHASPLHDIGKVAIPDSILLKPGRHTPEEFMIMKTHTTLGAETLRQVRIKYPRNSFINMGVEIAHFHHERWDGTGYPEGLSGGKIPLCARIMAVVDVYDALRAKRCYKEPFSHEESCDIIIKGRGMQFDPGIVDAFGEMQDSFKKVTGEMI